MKDYSAMSDFEINCAVEFGHNSYFQAGPTHCSFSVDENSTTTVGIKFYQDPASGYKDYCNNPADAWPIITANKISIIPRMDLWVAVKCGFVIDIDTPKLKSFIHASHSLDIPFCVNENPLKAAMIVYLQMMEQKS